MTLLKVKVNEKHINTLFSNLNFPINYVALNQSKTRIQLLLMEPILKKLGFTDITNSCL